jgi:hypothetical protein
MPFSGHYGQIACVLKNFWEGSHAVIEIPLVSRFTTLKLLETLSHGSDAGDVIVGTGEEH